ncbi:hypothetical protein [Clostridium beijerinckii]|jgi:hypothetical protein|uniref:Uncharacterized protein n=2 Tax=Clostridium beijerinckii TaxID=1520 RepID=A0AAE2V2U1_CLOBE|nr:hypothetical protein [Clostridium beijerinckii]ABR33804.1 hypothetical protein Cbei_1630 [Clostridium beijerinckii NCIMB 8052]AIU01278.1 hypothetical protein Cbs_1630 [Clostridium beijerinckii ATCC 35702]MBF7812228.1 hypothetical protein [Clostridium beijerinckii]NRT24911.1 hypothetical protein [Clostridium beijerinckii]NRT67496.1 hypothetical protein [Clostridium beijerinckii]
MHFKDDKERLKYNNEGFKLKNDYFSFKNNKMGCLYESCTGKAVNSHSISKKSSLISICENNEVLACKSIRNKEELTFDFKRVGINEATTFKGFCGEHEKLFEKLDKEKIGDLKDLLLQVYRCIGFACYNEGIMRALEKQQKERLKNYYNIDKLENRNSDLQKFLNETIEQASANKVSGFHRLRKVMAKYMELVNSLSDLDNRKIADIDRFENESINHIIRFKRVREQIPVALLNNFSYFYGERNCDIFFIAIPYENCTDIIMVIERDPGINCEEYWEYSTESDIRTLNLVETIMMMSEFWFIKPSVINSMSKERQEIIKNDIWFASERKHFEPYDMSIFDEVRKKLISECDDRTISMELDKINNIPYRENLEFRKEKMHKEMNRQYTQIMAKGR